MSPDSIRTLVVFPAPFGPSSPKISPSPTVNDRSCTAVKGAAVPALVGHDATVREPHDPVGATGDPGVMGDDDDRHPAVAVQLAERGHQLIRGGRVELAGRLVGEDHGRLVHEGSRDRHALLLAAGQLGRPMAGPGAEANELEQLLRASPSVASPRPVAERQEDVLDRGQRRDEVELLEDEADPLAPDRRQVAVGCADHVPPVDGQGPVGRSQQAAEEVEQRRLAGARPAHDRHELPRLHVEVDAIHRPHLRGTAPVDLGEATSLEDRHAAHVLRSAVTGSRRAARSAG
jgi:hypothetical protein